MSRFQSNMQLGSCFPDTCQMAQPQRNQLRFTFHYEANNKLDAQATYYLEKADWP